MEWKQKYLKYKLKYLHLKKNHKSTQMGGKKNYSIELEDLDTIAELVESKLKNKEWNKKTILLDCVDSTQMQTETIKLIKYIGKTTNIMLVKKHLESALILAVFCGYYLIVDELIKQGANPNLSYNGLSLVDIAVKFYFYKTAKVLMDSGGLSRTFHNSNQMFESQHNLNADPENLVILSDDLKSSKIYWQLRDKLLSSSKFQFDNLSRNIIKSNLENHVVIN